MSEFSDTHEEEPVVPIIIDNVGIASLSLKPLYFRGYWLIPTVTASIDLTRRRRGVHISRIAKLIHDLLNADSFDYNVIDNLAIRILETHSEAKHSKIIFKADVAGSESNLSITYRVSARSDGVFKRASEARVTVLNACPCALRVSTAISGKPYTHMQKTRVRVMIETLSCVDPLDIGLYIEKTFTTMKNVLSRLEEYKVITELYEKPLFNEDIVRLTIKLIYDKFREKLDSGDRITVSALSYETIHTFKIYSHISRRINELDEELTRSVKT